MAQPLTVYGCLIETIPDFVEAFYSVNDYLEKEIQQLKTV